MTSSDSFYPRIIALFRDPAVRASLITFAATSAAFAVALRLRERGRIRRFKEQVAREFESGDVHTFETSFSHAPDPFSRGIREVRPIDESLVREQLARHYSFFGDEAMQKIRGAFVIVVGLGGVGSHAAHMLARAGCGRLRIIDFDQVTLSSLNRHAVATQADVGTPKAVCLKNHLARICPFVKVEIAVELFNLEAAPRLLGGSPDFVLDCIDNIDTKLDLITYCHENKIPVIASMGSGAKHDPSRIQIADISQTQEDPLARTVRRKLKLTRNIEHGIPVVYSTEKPGPVKLLPLSDEMYEQLQAPGARPDDYAVLPEFRSRILPVLGTLPAMFGCAMASYVALRLADWPEEEFEPLPSKKRVRMYDRLYRDLRTRDQNVYQADPICPYMNTSEAGYLLDEIYRGFSVVSRSHDRPCFVRWDRRKPSTLDNVVVMTVNEADRHDALWKDAMDKGEDLDLRSVYGDEVVDLVKRRVAEMEREKVWR